VVKLNLKLLVFLLRINHFTVTFENPGKFSTSQNFLCLQFVGEIYCKKVITGYRKLKIPPTPTPSLWYCCILILHAELAGKKIRAIKPFKDEAQTALFKDPVRTAQ
jgi:hypothetical protein